MKVKVTQSCPTLCNPVDCIVHGIFQARILEWVAFPFSRGPSEPKDRTQVSHIAGGFFTSGARVRWTLIQSDVFINGGNWDPNVHKEKSMFSWRQKPRWCFDMIRNTKNCQKTTSSWRRSRGQMLLYNFQKETTLPTPWSLILNFQPPELRDEKVLCLSHSVVLYFSNLRKWIQELSTD